ncbi:MAG: hypothetical protein QF654_01510 [Alphaproteobacteria bacterium]|jgi:hypothetical protein|nr:hypothetical protein [Alphaproteobacteria bacterium]|tara:strand:- start:122 stop:340 length:219 start_codon:yes stop_codon:yes gene_type:complete
MFNYADVIALPSYGDSLARATGCTSREFDANWATSSRRLALEAPEVLLRILRPRKDAAAKETAGKTDRVAAA